MKQLIFIKYHCSLLQDLLIINQVEMIVKDKLDRKMQM